MCEQAYLMDFYSFCQNVGGSTAEVMAEILEVAGTLIDLRVTRVGHRLYLLIDFS